MSDDAYQGVCCSRQGERFPYRLQSLSSVCRRWSAPPPETYSLETHDFRQGVTQHPTFTALLELGKVIKTIFPCHYLHSEALRREIHEGLNVIENWNSANGFIFYGKDDEIATNRWDEQELAILSLHLLQLVMVFINTVMIQTV